MREKIIALVAGLLAALSVSCGAAGQWEPGQEYGGTNSGVPFPSSGRGIVVVGNIHSNDIPVFLGSDGARVMGQNPTGLVLRGSVSNTTFVVNIVSTVVNSVHAALADNAIAAGTAGYAATSGVALASIASVSNATYATVAGAATNSGWAGESGHATNADLAAHATLADYAVIAVSTAAAPYCAVSGVSSNLLASGWPTNLLTVITSNGVTRLGYWRP